MPFVNTEETSMKSQVSFNNPKSEMPMLINQKELDNMGTKMLPIKSFFMKEIYNLRQEISSVLSQLEQKRLHHSRNNDCVEKEESTNEELKAKLHSCQKEEIKKKQQTNKQTNKTEKLLKEEIKNK